MAFSVMTGGLFWQNGVDEPPPREDEKENGTGCRVAEVEEVHRSMTPVIKLTDRPPETATQDGPCHELEAAVLTPPVARQRHGNESDIQEIQPNGLPAGAEHNPEPQRPRTEAAPLPPSGVSRGAVAKSALHREAGCSALQFPDSRAITPRRCPSVRVIPRNSSPGTAANATSSPFTQPSTWTEQPKGWCRTPPPGPFATQPRLRQPAQDGSGYPDESKHQAWQMDSRGAALYSNGWRFQGARDVKGYHFAAQRR